MWSAGGEGWRRPRDVVLAKRARVGVHAGDTGLSPLGDEILAADAGAPGTAEAVRAVAKESATEPAPSAAAADAPGAVASSPAAVALASSDFLDPPTPVANESEQIFGTFASAAGRPEDGAQGLCTSVKIKHTPEWRNW